MGKICKQDRGYHGRREEHKKPYEFVENVPHHSDYAGLPDLCNRGDKSEALVPGRPAQSEAPRYLDLATPLAAGGLF